MNTGPLAHPSSPDDPTGPPRLSRRSALLGAAGLLSPLAARLVLADAVPLRQAAAARDAVLLLNGNENPYGPSPAAREAILANLGEVPWYAEGSIETLRAQIAQRELVAPGQVVIGSGSGELLRIAGLLAAASMPGGELVAARPTYEELPEFATLMGLKLRWVAADASLRHDLGAMRAAVGERTRLVYVCNPNNPTGTVVTREALEAFVRSLPAGVTVVVDEAYVDFVDEPGVASVAPLVQRVPNLVVLRTFSKLHGLAGLRVGYAVTTPALAADLARYSLVWPNTLGLAAASASLGDVAFQTATRKAIVDDRARIHAALDRLGLRHTNAQGNFVFFDTGQPVKTFQDAMRAQGIRVGRRFDVYDTWSRVTIGRREHVDRFLDALPRALAGDRDSTPRGRTAVA
jgi:histidinol-phosphate aminotransferase